MAQPVGMLAGGIRSTLGQVAPNRFALALSNVRFDPAELAAVIAPFLGPGSARYKIDISDITINRINGDDWPADVTLDTLLDAENTFFDSVLFMGLSAADRAGVTYVNVRPGAPNRIVSNTDLCAILFFLYFFILTRGAVSTSTTSVSGSDIPKFLYSVMSMRDAPSDYNSKVASFDLTCLDPSWAKYVPFQTIGREAVSRFGLGVAGYRLISIFKSTTPVDDLPQVLIDAYNHAVSMAYTEYTWDLHSATRSVQVVTQYGSLNACLANLALSVFRYEQLQNLVDSRALYEMPKYDNNSQGYLTWTGTFHASAGSELFGPRTNVITVPMYRGAANEAGPFDSALKTHPHIVGSQGMRPQQNQQAQPPPPPGRPRGPGGPPRGPGSGPGSQPPPPPSAPSAPQGQSPPGNTQGSAPKGSAAPTGQGQAGGHQAGHQRGAPSQSTSMETVKGKSPETSTQSPSSGKRAHRGVTISGPMTSQGDVATASAQPTFGQGHTGNEGDPESSTSEDSPVASVDQDMSVQEFRDLTGANASVTSVHISGTWVSINGEDWIPIDFVTGTIMMSVAGLPDASGNTVLKHARMSASKYGITLR